jgi:NAD+ diphosphatase
VLLARSPHFPPGIYSALAGFVDPGESLEAAVHREVLEETGIRVHNLRYFASQPWPFPHSLMVAFQADYASGELKPDGDEIEDARFFRADALPATFRSRARISVSQWLLEDFLRRKQ